MLGILVSAPEKLHKQQLLLRKLWPVTLESTVVPALSMERGWGAVGWGGRLLRPSGGA